MILRHEAYTGKALNMNIIIYIHERRKEKNECRMQNYQND